MGMDVEIAGEVLAQTVVVNEIAKGGASQADTHGAGQACANCGAALAGAYCHSCGQAAHLHHSLLHMAEELLHGLFHFETKAWRTIPALVFRPGQLTRAYIAGQRTRYVSPLALFLFLIFLMFLVFSLTGGDISKDISDKPHTRTGISKELDRTRAKLAKLEARRATLPAQDPKLEDIADEISDLRTESGILEQSLQQLDARPGAEPSAVTASGANAEMNNLAPLLERKLAENKVHSSFPWLERAIRHAAQNPELTMYKMKSTASKFAFMLMPISLPFLWLLFAFRRKFTMFDHAVFSLYSLSFMALLLMLVALLGRLSLDMLVLTLFVCAPPLHMYSQLRHAYQLSVRASLWRTAALLLVALCSLAIYAVLVAGLSL